jgi:hypothetical protein
MAAICVAGVRKFECLLMARTHWKRCAVIVISLPLVADFVAKGFCSFERARLIQDQAPTSNVDSKIHSSRNRIYIRPIGGVFQLG